MDQLHCSIHEAQRLIDTRKVFQNGTPITDKGAIVQGALELLLFEPQTQGLAPIFETPFFALYDKPSGLMVHPKNLAPIYTLVDEVRFRYGREANIAHRIDKETSGLVMVSRKKAFEPSIKGLFEERKITKGYLALVRGHLQGEHLIDAPIAKNRTFTDLKVKARIDPRGKRARTKVRPLRRYGPYTLVEAIPLTGRQHQIRLHLASIGHPIVGDPLYGVGREVAAAYLEGLLDSSQRREYTGAPRLMLHAFKLEFTYQEVHYILTSKQPFLQLVEELLSS